MTFNIEVGDQYLQQFEAEHEGLAADFARDTAKTTGEVVTLYPGAIISGVKPLCRFTPRGGISVACST